MIYRDRLSRVADRHGLLLARAAILADHVHLELGCLPQMAPSQVAFGFMNNLAYAFRMRAILEFSYYVGTIGEYDRGVLKALVPHESPD